MMQLQLNICVVQQCFHKETENIKCFLINHQSSMHLVCGVWPQHKDRTKTDKLFLSYLNKNEDKLIDFPLSLPICVHLPICACYSICSVLCLSALHHNYHEDLLDILYLSVLSKMWRYVKLCAILWKELNCSPREQ